MAQPLREVARRIGEDSDHDIGVLGCELLQLLDREPVADHPLVGDDVGRALAAVEQRNLAALARFTGSRIKTTLASRREASSALTESHSSPPHRAPCTMRQPGGLPFSVKVLATMRSRRQGKTRASLAPDLS
jgi:hypothetical protein